MATKKELLKNIQGYSPEEIADAIRAGIVTLYELGHDTEGQFTPLLKKQVKEILARPATPRAGSVITSHDSTEGMVNKQSSMDANDETTLEGNPLENALFITLSQDNKSGNENKGIEINYIETKSRPGMFRKPFSFSGRIRRLEYGLSVIIVVIVDIIMQSILSVAENTSESGSLIALYIVIMIFYIWFSLAQGAKRCHDRGNSGWYQFIPFYGLWMLFADGEEETNEYGECPK